MNSSAIKLNTWNVKKDKRLQSKKRKLEAFLNLIVKEEVTPKKKKEPEDTLQESYNTLKKELQKYVKKPTAEPSFYLTEPGLKAQVNFLHYNKEKPLGQTSSTLFIQDIYHLLLRSMLGNLSPYPMRWCKLEHPQNVKKTVVLVIEGLSKLDVINNISQLENVKVIFPFIVEIISSNIPFATELSTLHLVSDYCFRVTDAYSSLFPVEKSSSGIVPKNNKALSKLHLLLSPVQMVMENFPVPQSIFEMSNSDNYCFTKESYTPVTDTSPIFALDCEMCRTEAGKNEVTRIAIVDENLDTIYHTLVKPKAKITDYMTRFSGVTKQMLQNVKTRLGDVQKAIQTILPSDAILCGQSLNFDLHSLRMIHPYIIDTSVIFNGSGIRSKKNSLKSLAQMHLKEIIQNNKGGHNPVEDSVTAMKLVHLKLNNSIQYGDAVLGDNSSCKVIETEIKNTTESNSVSDNMKTGCDILNSSSKSSEDKQGFFSKVTKFSKKVCLVGNKDSLAHYCSDMIPENITKINKSNTKKVVRATISNMENFDLIMSHLVFRSEEFNDSLVELNTVIKQLYDSCPDKTLFVVVASGVDQSKFEELKSGLCMITVKKGSSNTSNS